MVLREPLRHVRLKLNERDHRIVRKILGLVIRPSLLQLNRCGDFFCGGIFLAKHFMESGIGVANLPIRTLVMAFKFEAFGEGVVGFDIGLEMKVYGHRVLDRNQFCVVGISNFVQDVVDRQPIATAYERNVTVRPPAQIVYLLLLFFSAREGFVPARLAMAPDNGLSRGPTGGAAAIATAHEARRGPWS